MAGDYLVSTAAEIIAALRAEGKINSHFRRCKRGAGKEVRSVHPRF